MIYSGRDSQLRWSTDERILVRTKPKNSFTLVVSDNSANIQTTFSPSLNLQANRDNDIRKGNNSFKWSIDEGKTLTLLHIPTGCYELKAINAKITRIRGNSDIITRCSGWCKV